MRVLRQGFYAVADGLATVGGVTMFAALAGVAQDVPWADGATEAGGQVPCVALAALTVAAAASGLGRRF